MNDLVKLLSRVIAILLGFRGLFEIIGFSSSTNLIAFLIILFLFFITVFRYEIQFPLFKTFTAFFITAFISSYINDVSFFAFLSYNKTTIGVLVLFLVVLINNTDLRTARSIKNFGLLIIIFQIPAYIFKFLVIGFSEDPAGTISMREGSATILIALIGFSYYLLKFLDSKNKKYLIYSLLFIIISQINEKRAIIFLIPLVTLYLVYKHSFNNFSFASFFVRRIHYFLFVLPLFIYLIAIINPFLNPTGEFLGDFDLTFLITFISNYMYRPDVTVWDYGRIQSFFYVLGFIINSDLTELFFGSGAGSIPAMTGGVTDTIGIRYGARMGFVWVILQHGLIGIIILITAFLSLFKILNKYNLNGKEIRNEQLFLKLLLYLYAFDFFFYSSVTLFYPIFIYIFIAQYNYVYKLCKANKINSE